LLISSQISFAQSAAAPVKDCIKDTQEYEPRTQCLYGIIKTLEGRLNQLESDTVKTSKLYQFQNASRVQCLEWLDTNRPPNFTWCVNRGDQQMKLIPVN
jgi:hypothetical protein